VSGTRLATLITGAGGDLGSRLAARFLESSERRLILWLHAENGAELERKAAELRRSLGPRAEAADIRGGDLRAPEPFAGVDPSEVEAIVHCAAVTRFNVEEELARTVNVEGAVKLYEFANQCGNLEQLALTSSIYACGLRDGAIPEEALTAEPEFSNHYEWSKWKSERRLQTEFDHLPWMVLRVATVVAETARGQVQQYNAFHNTLKLLFYGLISLVPGNRDTPLYFVTADFAVDAMSAILERGERHGVYHICHAPEESMTLGDLIDTAFARFTMDPDFRERRILKPLFCDEATFRLLAEGVDSFGGDVVREGLGSVVPFAPQLFSRKLFDNQRMKGAMDVYAAPDATELVSNTSDYLASTRWGRRVEDAA
jgi:nucleoside-diphosphate-sugar epimerase